MMFRALTTLGFAPRATNKVQARVVQPGLGLMSRFTEAVDALQPHQYLLVAGVYPGEKTWRPTDGVLKGLGLKDDDFCAGCLDAARQDTAKKDNDPDPDGLDRYVEHDRKKQVHFQGRASNTKVQATWIARTACQLNLGSLALHVSGYHGPRALMTNLAQLLHLGMADEIALFLTPTKDSPRELIPEDGYPMEAAFPGEYDRIEKYSTGQRGDVATWSQLFDYLMLHWDHPATK